MPDNRNFDPAVRENFNALVQIARYPNTPLVKQAIQQGHFGAVNLEEAQKTLLTLRDSFPQLGLGLPITQGYSPDTFEALINQFREIRTANQQLLVDVVREAIRRDDPSLLDHFPTRVPSRQHPESIPRIAPPPDQSPPAQRPTGTGEPEKTSASQAKPKEPPKPPHVVLPPDPDKPDKEEASKEEPIQSNREQEDESTQKRDQNTNQNSQNNNQTRDSRLDRSIRNRLRNRLRNTRLGRAYRRLRAGVRRSPQFQRLNNFYNRLTSPFRALNNSLNRAGNWIGDRTGYTRLNNYLSRIGNGLRNWVGNAARSLGSRALSTALRLGSRLGSMLANSAARILSNIAGRIGGQVAGAAARGAASLLAPIVLNPITWLVVGVVGLFLFVWWYDQNQGNSECDKPGQMVLEKRLGGIAGLGEEVKNGEKIEYLIVATYKQACRTKSLPRVVVTDTIPSGLSYIEGTAKSGFYSTAGTGPDGSYDESTKTITWTFTDFPMSNPVYIYFTTQPDKNDDGSWSVENAWITNEATVSYTLPGLPAGSGVIDVQSPTLQSVIDQAASRVGMDSSLLKAFLRVEAPQVLNYSEEEFQFFSTPGWWEGLEANAPTLAQNNQTAIRGYAYNTCAYRSCAPGADVRGVAQFEAKTWSGISPLLQFSDGHTPDRRNATDAIFGSALLNRKNAQYYTGTENFEWTEDVIRAAGRIYCGGPSAANRKLTDGACMSEGRQYEDLLWERYQEFLAR